MLRFGLISFLFLVGCSCATQNHVHLPPCEELETTIFNERHDQFLLEVCLQEIKIQCEPEDRNCSTTIYFQCVEDHLQMKLDQTKAFNEQKCWLNFIEGA